MNLKLSSKDFKADEIIVGFCFLIGLLLPHTSMAFLMMNPLMCLFLFSRYRFDTYRKGMNQIRVMLLCAMLMTFVINVGSVEPKAIVAAIYLMILFFCFPMVSSVRLRNIFLLIGLGVILLTQLAYIFHVTPIISIIDQYYPIMEEDENRIAWMQGEIDASNVFTFRNGGLYRNPNNCSRAIDFVLAAFLIENRKSNLSLNVAVMVAAMLGILMTGSRTGLVVTLLIIFLFIRQDNLISVGKQRILYILFALGVLYMMRGSLEFRGMQVGEGMNESSNLKWEIFKNYISSESNPIKLIFGTLQSTRPFDAEYGYIVGQYGFIGLLVYCVFWYKLFKTTRKENRCIFPILLWMLSSSIMMAYRSAFLAMMIFSLYYQRTSEIGTEVKKK